MIKKSLKVNFIWAFLGNAFAAFCMWLLLIILTKTSSPETVGLFGLAQAVALPVNMFFSLKLQVANVTDARHEYSFGHYIAVKISTSLATVLVVGLVGFIFYPVRTALVILVLGISYAVNEIREYFLSIMQKYERMDMMFVSRVAQGVLSLTLFGGLFILTKSLLIALFGIIITRLALLFIYDMPNAAKLAKSWSGESFISLKPVWDRVMVWRLVRLTAPLGLVAWLTSLFRSIPRIVMDGSCGREAVGYFTAMSSLLVVGAMITAALGQSINPRLARYNIENRRAFTVLFFKFLGLNISVGICLIVIAACWGKTLLTVCFTPDYAQHHWVFVNVAATGCFLFTFSAINSALMATRQFLVQVPIYLTAVIICGISSWFLVPRYEMLGATWSIMIGYAVGMISCLVFVIKIIKTPIKSMNETEKRGNGD